MDKSFPIRCDQNDLGEKVFFLQVCVYVWVHVSVHGMKRQRGRQHCGGTMKLMHTLGRTPVAKETQPVSNRHHGNLHPKSVEGCFQGAMSHC